MSIAQARFDSLDNVITMTALSSVPDEDSLIDQSYKTAYKVAYKLLGHREAAQDVAIETISRLLEKKKEDELYAPSYSARIAAHIVISSWRKDAVARKYAHMIAMPDIQSSDTTLSAIRIDLRRALKKLTQRQREVVVLRYLADLSENTVAESLGCSIGTVKSTTHDALERLKTMVEVTP